MRWQRRCTYATLGTCALTGMVWFVLMDVYGLPPSHLTAWWIGHGVSGFTTLVVLGAVLPHHVLSTWRSRRNRWAGGLVLGLMVVASLSALLLLYGAEMWHLAAHWCHIGVGLVCALMFPWHVLQGRMSARKT
jgi:hypothetical protein